MKKMSAVLGLGVLLLIIIFLSFSFKSIDEGNRDIVQTEKGWRTLNPGLHFILPWQTVKHFRVNQQLCEFELPLLQARQNLQVTVLWTVSNLSLFVQSNSDPALVDNLLKAEVGNLLLPASAQNIDPTAQSAALLQSLQNDSKLDEKGVLVKELWITNQIPDDAAQTKIFNNMKSVATTISQDIISKGTLQAATIRDQAEQNFLQAQSQALANVAEILGQGNRAAVKIVAPLYHQNPALFNAYVAAKVKLLSAQS